MAEWHCHWGSVQIGTASGNGRNSLSSRKWREISILPSVLSVRWRVSHLNWTSGQGAPLWRAMKCEARQVKREFCPVDKFGVTSGDDLKLVHYKSHININFGGSGWWHGLLLKWTSLGSECSTGQNPIIGQSNSCKSCPVQVDILVWIGPDNILAILVTSRLRPRCASYF